MRKVDRLCSVPATPIHNEKELKELSQKPFLFYAKKHKRSFALGILMLLATNAVDVLPPLFLGQTINLVVEGAPASAIYKTVGLYLLISVLTALFRYGWRVHWGYYHNRVAHDLRIKVFNKFTLLSQNFFQKNPVGELMSLINYDITTFRIAVGPGTLILLDSALLLGMTIPLMFYLSGSLAWKTLIFMPLVPIVISKMEKLVFDRNEIQRNHNSEMSGFIQEAIAGVRVTKSYAQENNQLRLFKNFNKKFENSCNHTARIEAAFGPVLEMAAASGAVILLLLGAHEVFSGQMKIGDFFTFYQYIEKIVWPMTALGLGLTFFQKGKASFKKILELLEAKIDVQDSGPQTVTQFKSLSIKKLNFSYPESQEPLLQNISFDLKAGESLGILGATGAGKSTFVVLSGRVRPTSNQIFLNDQPIESYSLASLRDTISYIPQENFLFSQTISENIALGKEFSPEQILRSAQAVNIDQEVQAMPEKYETTLGERGVNLSGGQKQRLSIARALHRKSPLTIFDDSLSAVDSKTEEHILKELKDHVELGNSTIIISHRLASLKLAQKILVLKEGKIEAFGTHQEALNQSKTYQNIYQLQHEGALDV